MSISVYQVQPIKNTNSAIILKIGELNNRADVLINKFYLFDNVKCNIVSTIYDIGELNDLKLNDYINFNIIKILINHEKGKNNSCQIAKIMFNFVYYVNNNDNNHNNNHNEKNNGKNNSKINNYLSEKNNVKKLDGSFEITFHFNKKKIVLEKLNKFDDINDIIEKMIMHISSSRIKNIITNII